VCQKIDTFSRLPMRPRLSGAQQQDWLLGALAQSISLSFKATRLGHNQA
jgi:hypothetical protein